jgi:hypothetical protein
VGADGAVWMPGEGGTRIAGDVAAGVVAWMGLAVTSGATAGVATGAAGGDGLE